MASFNDVLTDGGRVLINKMLAGKCSITFTKMVCGDGSVSEGQLLNEMMELVSPKSETGITVTQNDNVVNVTGNFNNKELSEGMYLREKGVYASDGTEEVLMIYANCGDEAEWIEPAIGGVVEKVMKCVMTFSQSDNVSVTVSSEGYVTRVDYDADMEYVAFHGNGEPVDFPEIPTDEVPAATPDVAGIVKYDNDTIKKNAAGQLYADTSGIMGVINTIYSDLSDNIQTKADRMENSASGHFLTVNEIAKSSDGGRPISISLYGKATQGGTSGKNLLDTNGLSEQTINGVTFTPAYENGMLQYININGTATSQARYSVKTITLGAGSYTLNGCIGGSSTTFRIITANIGSCYNGDVTGTLSAETSCNTSIIVESGATVNNIKIYPMLRLASVTDATYEPYTGGIASPNPDYPQEVTVAGADGDIVLTSCRKNLLSISEYTTNPAGGTSKYMNVPYLEYGRRYFLSGKTTDGVAFAGANCQMVWWDENNKRIWASQLPMWSSGMVCDVDLSSAKSFSIYTNDGLAGKTIQIQLEEGAITPYERYTGTTATIPLTNGLAGIPVSSGGNYTGESGQQWVCDTIEFTAGTGGGILDSGKYVQRVGKVVFDGSSDENWQVTSTASGYRIYTSVLSGVIKNSPNDSVAKLLCNQKSAIPAANTYSNISGIGVDKNGLILIYDEDYNTSDITPWIEHLAENPMELYYELAEPITTSLTSEQLSSLGNIHTFYPVTNLFTDDICDVGMGYVADTKAYIDNKFNELATALLSAVGSEG